MNLSGVQSPSDDRRIWPTPAGWRTSMVTDQEVCLLVFPWLKRPITDWQLRARRSQCLFSVYPIVDCITKRKVAATKHTRCRVNRTVTYILPIHPIARMKPVRYAVPEGKTLAGKRKRQCWSQTHHCVSHPSSTSAATGEVKSCKHASSKSYPKPRGSPVLYMRDWNKWDNRPNKKGITDSRPAAS